MNVQQVYITSHHSQRLQLAVFSQRPICSLNTTHNEVYYHLLYLRFVLVSGRCDTSQYACTRRLFSTCSYPEQRVCVEDWDRENRDMVSATVGFVYMSHCRSIFQNECMTADANPTIHSFSHLAVLSHVAGTGTDPLCNCRDVSHPPKQITNTKARIVLAKGGSLDFRKSEMIIIWHTD